MKDKQKELARFTDPIRAEFSNDGKSLTLLQGFFYYRKGAQESRVEVPAGFISDGFSNFGLHFIVKRYGRGLKCAILHDYLCEQAHAGKISRKECDEIFLEAMLETKSFNPFKARVIYLGVRIYAKWKGYK